MKANAEVALVHLQSFHLEIHRQENEIEVKKEEMTEAVETVTETKNEKKEQTQMKEVIERIEIQIEIIEARLVIDHQLMLLGTRDLIVIPDHVQLVQDTHPTGKVHQEIMIEEIEETLKYQAKENVF